jgi:LacI family transcriptional regulator
MWNRILRVYSADLRHNDFVGHQVAIVMSEVFLRRLTPALTSFVRRDQDYRIVNIDRPNRVLRKLLRDLRPDGLITEWLVDKTDMLLDLGLNIPTVIVDTDFSYPGVVSVDVDDWAVGREAARAFLQSGLKNFACLGNGEPYSEQRVAGFGEIVEGHGQLAVHTESGFEDTHYSESFKNPSKALGRWLRELPKPVGIFAVHDPLGRFLCAACQQLGFKVPDEVAVIGANNDELVCDLTHPKLSSVAIPWKAIGEVAAESMQRLMSGDQSATDDTRLVAPGGVVLRHSANHLNVDDPMLRRAMTYLSERLEEPINVSQLCRDLRVARRTLERRFREYYRCTPWDMLCQLRINRAKLLLTETNHSVAMVAERCGFNDPEQLAVVFKRLVGIPPSHHRRSSTDNR